MITSMITKKIKKVISTTTAAALSAAMILTPLSPAESTVASAASDANYAEALAMSLYFFDSNECGSSVDSNPLTWRGNCHTYDAKASLSSAVNFNSAYKSIVDPDGDGYVDVSGGYHDAGDHIKFNLTNGFAASSLAMSYYLNEGAYAKAGCTDHLFEILKKISGYLMKTTFLNSDGSVATICYNVSDVSDHDYWAAPEVQTYERKTYWFTSINNNATVCGEMASALAGTAYVLKNSDSAYAAKCLKYAKAIYEFGNKYAGNETAGMNGMYNTDSMYQDEMALAQAWLYLNDEASLPTYKPTTDGCYNGSYYDYYMYCWDKVWCGYSTMMYKITGDSAYASEMKFELNNQGGCPTNSYNAAGWGASRYNCSLQMMALGLANGNASSDYAKGAKYQMDYILGNNSFGYSFLVGYGDKWPTHIHHRAANPGSGSAEANTSAKYTNYGMLIGGPDSSGNYQDHQNSYQFTEPALDYNACFALACAGLVNLYGGDASALKPIITNASEINENYVFNNGQTIVEPTPPNTNTTTKPAATTTKVTTTTLKTDKPLSTTTTASTSAVIGDSVSIPVTPSNGKYIIDFSAYKGNVASIKITFSSSSNTNGSIFLYGENSSWNGQSSFDCKGGNTGTAIDISPDATTGEINIWYAENNAEITDVTVILKTSSSTAANTTTTTTSTTKPTTTTTTTTTTTSTTTTARATTSKATTTTTKATTASSEITTTNITTTTEADENLIGDINLDKSVNMIDVLQLHKYIGSIISFSTEQKEASDLNDDVRVNVFDLIILKQIVFGS